MGLVPLFLVFAVAAVLVALALSKSGAERSRGRFAATAVGTWVAMIIVAIVILTVATLIFGR